MTLDKGATVYDALAASGISHSGDSYITAIGGLSEKQFGGQSGWKYYVNGTAPGKSCVDYTPGWRSCAMELCTESILKVIVPVVLILVQIPFL